MTNKNTIQDLGDSSIPPRAVSVYGQQDAVDDFPVLKAFQQYIDAEQAKARKRLTLMAAFFGVFTFVVIAIFVTLLLAASERNQKLNDRILEYVMKDRIQTPAAAPVVVQSPAQQDNSALMAMTSQLEEMRKQLQANEARAQQAEKSAKEAADKAAAEAVRMNAPKQPSAEELEIRRLKALLTKEREAAAVEKERRRQEELEAYRRKHYPELYEPKKIKKEVPKVEVSKEFSSQAPNEVPMAKIEVEPEVAPQKTPVKELTKETVEAVAKPVDKSPSSNPSLNMAEVDEILSFVSKSSEKEEKKAVATKTEKRKAEATKKRDAETAEKRDAETAEKRDAETKEKDTSAKKKEQPVVHQKEIPITIDGKKSNWRIPD